jgi:hypothetical protein
MEHRVYYVPVERGLEVSISAKLADLRARNQGKDRDKK